LNRTLLDLGTLLTGQIASQIGYPKVATLHASYIALLTRIFDQVVETPLPTNGCIKISRQLQLRAAHTHSDRVQPTTWDSAALPAKLYRSGEVNPEDLLDMDAAPA
jgi:hypothetical protein